MNIQTFQRQPSLWGSFKLSRSDVALTLFLLIMVVVSMIVLSGCSFLQTKVGPTAKTLTDYYCSQPLEARLTLRAQIDLAIAPATIKLTCPGDIATVPPTASTEPVNDDHSSLREKRRALRVAYLDFVRQRNECAEPARRSATRLCADS